MKKVEFINKYNLRTARENMGLDLVDASRKVSHSKKNVVAQWESGESLPSWSQVLKLAKVYNVPELAFFSNDKIERNKQIPDYRINIDPINNEKVNKLINIVISRQKWLEKKLRDEGYGKNKLLGLGNKISDPKLLAQLISSKLKIEVQEIKNIRGIDARKKTLKYLTDKAEQNNVFVGKTISYIKLSVNDLRGLFISNDYCPFIVLNRSDAVAAQIFSFVHEMAHLFRRSDAISNSLDFRSASSRTNQEEIFCNKVAAELLLPEGEFTKDLYLKDDIDSISDLYKVSKIFVFYRLKDLGKIPKDQQSAIEKEIEAETANNIRLKEERKRDSTGGNYNNLMKDSNGLLLNNFVTSLYFENKIGYTEAAKVLRLSPEEV